uniref:Uncharacterized protein n=1 Tax=Anguilla anguilla TaxID=7936 RepID=A0A0E9X3W7_ANGAN
MCPSHKKATVWDSLVQKILAKPLLSSMVKQLVSHHWGFIGNFHGLLYFLHHSDRQFRKHTGDLLISDWCKSGSGGHFVLTLQRLVWPSCEPACRCLKHVIVQALSVSEIQLRDVSFFIYCIIIVVKVKSYQYYY